MKRIEESATFRAVFMPVSWLLSAVGLVGMVLLLVLRAGTDEWSPSIFWMFTALACAPILLLVVRIARGHFRRDLQD